jgi:endonuclease/exonuclease/phosphatase family metal-dependent hydrolase
LRVGHRILAAVRLRILTINLYNGRADVSALADALGEHSPDVVAAQELDPDGAAVLEEWGSSHLLDPRRDTTGMGMAVRGPARLSRLSFPYRDPVVASLPAEPWGLPSDVEIINTHLVNPIARPIVRSRRLRAAELTALQEVLGPAQNSNPRVLVGDLNSSPSWPLYRHLTRLATDAAVAAGTARRSWGPWPSSPRLLRIDHAFVQRLEPLATRLVTIRGADHCGLLLDVAVVR